MKFFQSIVILTLLSITILPAQEKGGLNEKVIVVGAYEPTLKDAVKVTTDPSLLDTGTIRLPIEYNVSSRQFKTPFTPELIKPAKIVGEPITQLHRNYLKFGIGSYISPYFQFYHANTRSVNASYGFQARHFSSWLPIKEYGKSSFSQTDLLLFGKRILKQGILSGDLFYTNDSYYYYGFKDSPDSLLPALGTSDIKNKTYAQTYQQIGFNASYRSTFDSLDKIHHVFRLQLSDLIGKYGINELNAQLDLNLYKRFSLFGNNKQTFGIQLSLDYYNLKQDSSQNPLGFTPPLSSGSFAKGSSVIDIHPYFLFNLYDFDLTFGLNTFLGISDGTVAQLYPEISASRSLFNKLVFIRLGMNGSFEQASINKMRKENPYISPLSAPEFTRNPLNLSARIEFALDKNLDLNAVGVYSVYRHTPLFGLDSNYALQNVYKPLFDNFNQLKLGGEIVYTIENEFKLGAGIHFFKYNTTHEEEPWYKPAYQLHISGKYILLEKFIFSLNTCFSGKMKAYLYENESGAYTKKIIDLTGRIDLNVAAEYRYNKKLSFFLWLNNLANQQYFEWTHYPSQRFNLLLGLTYSF